MRTEIKDRQFLLDGAPFRILSGEMHYFRIPRDCWRDRLNKLKACGLNTVATYMPWNLHERRQGTFDFSGNLDVRSFLALADDMGIRVILRPGPYICSEWDFGGFPAWLLAVRGLRLRCSEPNYLHVVERYLKAVFEQVSDFYDRNIIAMQIENGYASYGNDMDYYRFLQRLVLDSGFRNVILAADGDSDTRIANDMPEGVWRTLMCGRTDPRPQLEFLQAEQPDKPLFIIEYWNGQGITVGNGIRPREPRVIVDQLRLALEMGAHINLYMFHGGTSFGFMSGALRSLDGHYRRFVTSYDVAAPVSEAGDIRELYRLYRPLFAQYNPDFSLDTPIPPDSPKADYGEVPLTAFAPLFDNLDALSVHVTSSPCPLSLEDIGGDYGFARYTTRLSPQRFTLPIHVAGLDDCGWVFYNGAFVKFLTKEDPDCMVETGQGGTLEIVVENLARTSFFCNMEQNRKGITDGVILNGQQYQHGWTCAAMPMEDTSGLAYRDLPSFPVQNCLGFFRGTFNIAGDPADTYLQVPTGTRGFCRVNGRLLGRYDRRGPFHTLFVPSSFLMRGGNVIEVCECAAIETPVIRLIDHPLVEGL